MSFIVLCLALGSQAAPMSGGLLVTYKRLAEKTAQSMPSAVRPGLLCLATLNGPTTGCERGVL